MFIVADVIGIYTGGSDDQDFEKVGMRHKRITLELD